MVVGRSYYQSRIGERESFIFSAFFLVRTSRKDTLKEFETAIKMACELGIGSVSQVLNLDTQRTDIPIVPSVALCRNVIFGQKEFKIKKVLMQVAFENATLKMIEKYPKETACKYPHLYHWYLTK